MVNIVAMIVALLRTELGVSYVFAEIPAEQARPVLRIEESGGGPQPSSLMPDRMTIMDIQLSAWAETKPGAWNLISSASSALHGAVRSNPVHSQGVLVTVQPLAPVYLPDEDWPADGRPGPRYEQTVRIRAHG